MPSIVETETPPASETDTPADLPETVRALPAEGQRAVLSYAQFLRAQEVLHAQEAARQAEEAYHDGEWERLFNDPIKMANFARWADEQFATQTSKPLDSTKL